MTLPQYQPGNTVVLIWMYAGGFASLVCGALLWLRRVRLAAEAAGWPVARGDVLHTEIVRHEDSDGDEFEPRIIYAYRVDGRVLSGQDLRIGPKVVLGDQASAVAALAPYRPGQKVAVRYDPENPERSVLEPRPATAGLKSWVIFGLFLIGSAIYITIAVRLPSPW